MDFSSALSSVKSLLLRTPPPALPDEILSSAKLLESQHSPSPPLLSPGEVRSAVRTLCDGNRWEPLGVGLNLCIEYCKSDRNNKGTTPYLAGPRPTDTEESNNSSSNNDLPVPPPTNPTDFADPINPPASTADSAIINRNFCNEYLIPIIILPNLQNPEPRIRSLVATLCGNLRLNLRLMETSEAEGSKLLESVVPVLKGIIVEMAYHSRDKGATHNFGTVVTTGDESPSPSDSSSSASTLSTPLDDTTGWKSLETSLHALSNIVSGPPPGLPGGGGFVYADEEMRELVTFCAGEHVNRHVRAGGLQLFGEMIRVELGNSNGVDSGTGVDSHSNSNSDSMWDFDSPLTTSTLRVLRSGLSDNWSQVRMAASVMLRTFINCSGVDKRDDDKAKSVMRDLIPAMVFNRFYLADGVRLYSQENWKILTKINNNGIELVGKNLDLIVPFYKKMATSNNHVVRESSGQAFGELAIKIGRNADAKVYSEALAKELEPEILPALLDLQNDESWPVSTAASLSLGDFVLSFPKECKPSLPLLIDRWMDLIGSQVWSVREDAAISLGKTMLAYTHADANDRTVSMVLNVCRGLLPSAMDQLAMTVSEWKRNQNDAKSHTDTQLFSCGSLAPKGPRRDNGGGFVSAGRIAGGCGDCMVNRDREPWENSDGAVYLVRELAPFLDDKQVVEIMGEVVAVMEGSYHFPEGSILRATVFTCLPEICTSLQIKRFKNLVLELFLPEIVRTLESSRRGGMDETNISRLCVR